MSTQCNTSHSTNSCLSLPHGKDISIDFSGGNVTSDSGVILLAEIDARIGLTESIASCIKDTRQPGKIIHPLQEMIQQRTFQISCGYEDCNDAQTLRKDPAFKIAVGKKPETDDDLSSQPTLSRLENSITPRELYRMGEQFLKLFIKSQRDKDVRRIVIDCDATDDPTHGNQQLTFFQAYYDCYCYLPLIVCATVNYEKQQHLVGAVLCPSNRHPGKNSIGIISRIIRYLRNAFPSAELILRSDSGFALPEIYEWCEKEHVNYVISISKNNRLLGKALPYRASSCLLHQFTGQKTQLFGQFSYAADSWTRERRIIVKAEYLKKGENVRFVVTNIAYASPGELYHFYCQRGDMENRIAELKNHLKADRTSCTSFLANQFRLFLHSCAFILIQALQNTLKGTELENAQADTIRVKLLKIGARIKESVRRIWIHCTTAFPLQDLFWKVWQTIRMKFSSVTGYL
ncbi:MAG: IS1380 family transposase [Vulcanimicrobiota bacterium]